MRLVALVYVLAVGLAATADDKKDPKTPRPKKTNRLAREISPYLLQHAHNPVDWYPWGAEAFEKAKKEKKLIFLSIGYSSCHWCHVMEKESFAHEEVAKILNEHFVCIKVDREERPDIDNIYMTALHVLGQRGGWPLSMFLTAEAKPIVGGTYWPREDREINGRKVHGFKSILKIVAEAYREKAKDIHEDADRLAEATTQALLGLTRGLPLLEINRELVTAAVDGLLAQHDKVHGGFGSPDRNFSGPKFPTPPRLMLLQEEAVRSGSKEAAKALDLTLDRMARGGIYDHLGGGFHRYSVDRTWTVPHFEKMLYDNAQLVELYSLAWQRAKIPLYQRTVRETLGYIEREMTSPEGVFYSALDADSEGEEGRFYVWTDEQLAAILKEKASLELFRKVYGAEGKFNFEDKYRIPLLPTPIAEPAKEQKLSEDELLAKLDPLRQRLFSERAKRERPFLDTKVLTSWNGQMIAGYAVAGQVFGDKKYLATAEKAAEFVLKNLRTKEGRLLRTWAAAPGQKAEARLNGYLDDYAYLVHGLLCLHEATGARKWLDEAKALTDLMVKYHGDDKGGFFYTSSDHEKLFARAKDQHDGAQPSGNSMAARNLVRLAAKTGDRKYRDLAEKTIKSLAVPLKNDPEEITTLVSAVALFLELKK